MKGGVRCSFYETTKSCREEEWTKWLGILAAALIALALAAARSLGVGNDTAVAEPRMLPASVEDTAEPMSDALSSSSDRTWEILCVHERGLSDQAIEGWRGIRFSDSTEVWRNVALAAAYLDVGDLDQAAEALDEASHLQPNNAVLNYYRGLLRLEQALAAEQWMDAQGPMSTRLVSHVPKIVAPNTRSMYRLVAAMELQQAITNADQVRWSEPLVADSAGYDGRPRPTVGELLQAIGAEMFEANSHHMLGSLYLERGNTELAEHHMDQARDLGRRVMFGYRELGEYYESQGRHGDAIRAFGKAMTQGGGVVDPGRKLLNNLRQTLTDCR